MFHVVFDDWFNTVTANSDALPDFQTPEWTQTFGDSEFQYPIDEDEDPDGPESPPPLHNVARESRVRQAMDATTPDPAPSSDGQLPDLKEPPAPPVSHSRELTPPVSHAREPQEITPSPPAVPSEFPTPEWLDQRGSNIDDSDDEDDPAMPALISRGGYDSEEDDDNDDADGKPKPKSSYRFCRPPAPSSVTLMMMRHQILQGRVK